MRKTRCPPKRHTDSLSSLPFFFLLLCRFPPSNKVKKIHPRTSRLSFSFTFIARVLVGRFLYFFLRSTASSHWEHNFHMLHVTFLPNKRYFSTPFECLSLQSILFSSTSKWPGRSKEIRPYSRCILLLAEL